jgi:hypothetical protein
MKKKYTFGGQKAKNKPSEPKNGNWGPKSVWSCDLSIDWKFYMEQEKNTFGVKKVKISLQSPKTEFGPQNRYGRLIYP